MRYPSVVCVGMQRHATACLRIWNIMCRECCHQMFVAAPNPTLQDEDNVKQDISIDVYGRKEKQDKEVGCCTV